MSSGATPRQVVPKHIQDWRKAAGDVDIEAKQNAFVNVCGQLRIAEAERKQWYVEMTAILGRYNSASLTPDHIREILLWMDLLRQRWGKPSIEALAQIVVKIHKKDIAGGNGQAERTRVIEWLENVGLGALPFGKIQTFCNSLEVGVSNLLSEIWADAFCGKATVKILLGPGLIMPPWMLNALRHKRACAGPIFWMKALTDTLVIVEVASLIYGQGEIKQHHNEINAFACSFVRMDVARVKKFMTMFPDWAQWDRLRTEFDAQFAGVVAKHYLKKVVKIGDLLPANRKRVSSNQEDPATLADLGQWLVHYREVIARLIRHDYPPAIIIGMYRHGLGFREMLAVTWIRGTVVPGNPQPVGFKRMGANGQVEHGFIFADPKHLAERHLYCHFQFNRPLAYPEDEIIKDLNSFHSSGTTLQALANLYQRGDMIVSSQDGLTDVATYKIATKVWGGNNRRVATLYPDLPVAHQDRFTRRELERIRDVMAVFVPAFVNTLPEIAYFAPPRADRA